jgi:hypothetical protein
MDLSACPFCGADDKQDIIVVPQYRVAVEREAYVFCRNCHARGPLAFYADGSSDERAKQKWNKRVK